MVHTVHPTVPHAKRIVLSLWGASASQMYPFSKMSAVANHYPIHGNFIGVDFDGHHLTRWFKQISQNGQFIQCAVVML